MTMLSINVQDLGGLELLLPLMLCCMMPMMFRGGQSGGQQEGSKEENDSWYVTTNPQETYDHIVKETDEWREGATAKRKPGRLSFLSRKKPVIFVVDDAVPMRLYRLQDDRAGEITFELTEAVNEGTLVKATYNIPARKIIQNFKAELPTRALTTTQSICPSCGKEIQPDFTTCPYCGEKLNSS
jgi:hypothetical protein